MERDSDAGECVEAIEEGRVEREAEVGELAQRRRIVRIARGEHSGGSGGGFGERLCLIEDGDAEAAAMEFERERKADDAGSSDADVGVTHKNSLVRFENRGASGFRSGMVRDAQV